MLYLLFAIASSATIAITMRISSGKVGNSLCMLASNYFVCALCGALYAFPLPTHAAIPLTVGLSVLNSVLLVAGFVLLQVSTRKNGIVLSSIFMKLGLLVPFVLSILFFQEAPTAIQIIGFCLAVASIILINAKSPDKAKGFGILLIFLLLAGGSCDAMNKVYEVLGPPALAGFFLFLSFALAFLICAGLAFLKKERPRLLALLFGAIIGVPNFFSSKFLLSALAELPAVVVYPTFSIATMLVVTLTGALVFREKLSRRQWLAFGLIAIALLLLNK